MAVSCEPSPKLVALDDEEEHGLRYTRATPTHAIVTSTPGTLLHTSFKGAHLALVSSQLDLRSWETHSTIDHTVVVLYPIEGFHEWADHSDRDL